MVLFFIHFLLLTSPEDIWQKIDEGLYLNEFVSPQKSIAGDSKITIVKIDPQYYSFRFFSASRYGKRLTAKEWSKEKGLVAVINAGMFFPEGRHIGYAKDFNHIDNGTINNYGMFFLSNPEEQGLPEVQIVGREEFAQLKERYNTIVQNMSVIKNRKVMWKKSEKMWSMALLGIDSRGNVLYIYSGSPYSVYDLAYILLKLPISIENAMYLEGGSEASLYLKAGNIEVEKCGSCETGFNVNKHNLFRWTIPNIIGVIKEKK